MKILKLTKFLVNEYLSRSETREDHVIYFLKYKRSYSLTNIYLKFNIYCLINNNKFE